MAASDYEELRRRNLEDNRRILAELGLSNPFKLLPKVIKKSIKKAADETYEPKKKRAKVTSGPADLENYGSVRGTRRLSARLRGQEPGTDCVTDDVELEEQEKRPVKHQYIMPDRPNWYGEVPGIAIGTTWMMRIDCCRDGIHRPTVAGIHAGPEGAYSLALSGGYEDDIDLGECFTYTGEGGRDLKGTKNNPKNLRTAPQSKDQQLTRGNLALSRSVETGNPVRVIRGYKLRSPFAPDEGYRYDGLYTVEKFWFTKGLSGYRVYKFALQRCIDQASPPWELASDAVSPSKTSDSGFSDTNIDGESTDGSNFGGGSVTSTFDCEGNCKALTAGDAKNDFTEGNSFSLNKTDDNEKEIENLHHDTRSDVTDCGEGIKPISVTHENEDNVKKQAGDIDSNSRECGGDGDLITNGSDIPDLENGQDIS